MREFSVSLILTKDQDRLGAGSDGPVARRAPDIGFGGYVKIHKAMVVDNQGPSFICGGFRV